MDLHLESRGKFIIPSPHGGRKRASLNTGQTWRSWMHGILRKTINLPDRESDKGTHTRKLVQQKACDLLHSCWNTECKGVNGSR